VRFLHEIGWKWGIKVYKFIFLEKKFERTWPKLCDAASDAVTMRLYTRMKITPQFFFITANFIKTEPVQEVPIQVTTRTKEQ
jgi:hypothetical protein